MIATTPFVKKTFDRFNALCFDNALSDVPITLTKAGTFLGKIEYKSRHDLFGIRISHYDFRLKISTGFNLPEEELEDVIIHEMIHYFIASQGIRDTSAHGKVFRRIMDTINENHGRHISVSHHGTPEQNLVRGGNPAIRKHYICVSTFPNGDEGITVCSSTKLFEICRLLPARYKITGMKWYGSLDPFFNRYPRSNTPKIYKITEEDLTEHLRDSVPLRCDGHVLEPLDDRH